MIVQFLVLGYVKHYIIAEKEKVMRVSLKCFAKLSTDGQCDYRESTTYEINEGATVHDLARRANLVPKDVKIAFVNNRNVSLEMVLVDGDRVGLAPAVGGM